MNLKDILLPLTLVFVTSSLVQYVINRYAAKSDVKTEQVLDNNTFIAPEKQIELEPLDLDIDFYVDSQVIDNNESVETVDFNNKSISFSSNGAVINRLIYNLRDNKIDCIKPAVEKSEGAFLIALNGLDASPYYYNLLDKQIDDEKAVLTYRGESLKAIVTKKFTVYKEGYKIDLDIKIEPKNDKVRARILFPSPEILGDYYTKIDAVLYSDKNSLERKPLSGLQNFGKNYPTLFGLESHYLVNILCSDLNKFSQRAYYKVNGVNKAQAIFESPYIDEKNEWSLSFYCGPKDIEELGKVDSRLEELVGYGWFTSICKLGLKLLNFLYKKINNYGVAILVLALLVRLVTGVFTFKSKKTLKKEAEIRQKYTYLEQKYKNDPEKLNEVKLEYFKQSGGDFVKLLLAFIQLPIIIGLNKVLSNGIQLYKAPFLWIDDLSMPDPYYILQCILGFSAAVQFSISSSTPNKNKNGSYYLTQAMLGVFIGALTSGIASGLSLYLGFSAILVILQAYIQKLI